ncbi:secondary thiamine-phosphate synthase enzyme YjbQ [Marinobacterium arenosum]|uniref:secondary thiamine-phosphate synthase enzyme YjbQ n=1 Tax=Marinobacterium arenosum TaxID=2862496 RepID=UPI001C97803F|nr:secondary thiamine-phosphate synthase enzyme YjbQ [Marinobacterium arenosum]MBY4677188.1 secondary thiamine-phosphate synthase enzyme YjbQ [Marinobacterium arenosum]
MVDVIEIQTHTQSLYEITGQLQSLVHSSGIEQGLCSLLIQHTSASLLVQENADPSAQHDLERWFNRLVPEHDPIYTHTIEGPDDMPSHVKSALTTTTLSIPVMNGKLALGTWQGVFLWEHRHRGSRRRVVVHIGR